MKVQLQNDNNESHKEIINSLCKYINEREVSEGLDLETLKECIKDFFVKNTSIVLTNTQTKNESILAQEIRKTIAQYETLIEEQKAKGESTMDSVKFKAILLKQLNDLETRSTKQILPLEKINERLRDIFSFYCKQQMLIGKWATFEQLETMRNHMNLAEFMKLCKDFDIILPKQKVTEIFKKLAKNSKELDWNTFNNLLQRIASELTEEKILEEGKRLKRAKTKEAKLEILNEIEELKEQSEETRLGKLYEHMGVANSSVYKKKMVGMSLPFHIRDKNSRMPLSKANKVKSKRKQPQTNILTKILTKHKPIYGLEEEVEKVTKSNKRSELNKVEEETDVVYEDNKSEAIRMIVGPDNEIGLIKKDIQKEMLSNNKVNEERKETKNEMQGQLIEELSTSEKSKLNQWNNQVMPIIKRKELTWEVLKNLSYKDINEIDITDEGFIQQNSSLLSINKHNTPIKDPEQIKQEVEVQENEEYKIPYNKDMMPIDNYIEEKVNKRTRINRSVIKYNRNLENTIKNTELKISEVDISLNKGSEKHNPSPSFDYTAKNEAFQDKNLPRYSESANNSPFIIQRIHNDNHPINQVIYPKYNMLKKSELSSGYNLHGGARHVLKFNQEPIPDNRGLNELSERAIDYHKTTDIKDKRKLIKYKRVSREGLNVLRDKTIGYRGKRLRKDCDNISAEMINRAQKLEQIENNKINTVRFNITI